MIVELVLLVTPLFLFFFLLYQWLATPTPESNAVKIASKQISSSRKAEWWHIYFSWRHRQQPWRQHLWTWRVLRSNWLKAKLNERNDSLLTSGASPDDSVMQELTCTDKMLFGSQLLIVTVIPLPLSCLNCLNWNYRSSTGASYTGRTLGAVLCSSSSIFYSPCKQMHILV